MVNHIPLIVDRIEGLGMKPNGAGSLHFGNHVAGGGYFLRVELDEKLPGQLGLAIDLFKLRVDDEVL